MFYKYLLSWRFMKKYCLKDKKIVKELVDKSFLELKGRNLYFFYFSGKKYSGGAWWALPFLRIIFINKKRKFSKKQLIGVFVHELCHLEIFQKRGWLRTSFLGIFYWIFPRFRKQEEDKTEKLAIKKGYARDLYELRQESERKFNKLKREKLSRKSFEIYLTSKEIKSYAKKIGKW